MNNSNEVRTITEQQNVTALPELKLGEFQGYDSQLAIPEFADTRIVKCLYQISAKTGAKVHENVFVRIPTSHITTQVVEKEIEKLAQYVVTFLQEQEDLQIKAAHKAGQTKIFTEYLGLSKVIEALEVKEAGARLNKEKIELWFDSEVEANLAVLFAEKMSFGSEPSEEQLEKLEAVLAAYKGKFASLASGKAFIKEEDCIAMISVVKSCNADKSLIGSRFIGRLESMKEKKEDLLLSL